MTAAALFVLCFAGCFAESTFEEIPFGIPSDEVFLQEEDFFEEAFFGAEELEAGLLLEGAAADELPVYAGSVQTRGCQRLCTVSVGRLGDESGML